MATVKRRKPKAERKELVLRIRTTADQRAKLDQAAKRKGLPVSSWLLSVGLEAAEKAEGGGRT